MIFKNSHFTHCCFSHGPTRTKPTHALCFNPHQTHVRSMLQPAPNPTHALCFNPHQTPRTLYASTRIKPHVRSTLQPAPIRIQARVGSMDQPALSLYAKCKSSCVLQFAPPNNSLNFQCTRKEPPLAQFLLSLNT